MGALDAFYTTWSQARTTFGEGAPITGDSFDGSSRLREMKSTMESAAPDERWQGTAAQAYAAKNAEHAAVYGKLADLDQRMAAEVSRAAGVVNAGRQNLEQIQSWVTSMDASIPPGQSAETMRMILARRGLGQVSDTVQRSTEEMGAIGGRVDDIRREYDEVAGETKKLRAGRRILRRTGFSNGRICKQRSRISGELGRLTEHQMARSWRPGENAGENS
ncbi:EspA/EspE family type VII secretion system effector [Mycobacteroides abscessus subsp. abscessus]|uniref:EspA/EspE family type VII secretion system effector n=1 Tax=Mycolicibacterium fortuitum TaxID=1766 RepID=UPI0007EB378D|nr:EspA/EspE family type VII secretion system effector [Mycolicibacterium fortuitum]MDO3239554.1 EspA/EspE family type VII secretion system effector [Mycobacteroides abscessus subsp. abscessus]MCA4753952.1 DUF4226 domain-containing protein [Mycolicibacterium fortuitum]MDG5770172.1 EspA/EspE family type VII secretion system effector [Mycolicibacterium fortuitum]MDG5781279.1 EspA/EspE family type VII secretion system effector [Mycolicibacterium fortuitum]OBB07467.1 DUF4226 domain-containing prot